MKIRSFRKEFRGRVVTEMRKMIASQGIETAVKQANSLLNEAYLETQLSLKNHQERYHALGVISYYKMQHGLIRDYEKFSAFTRSDWQKNFDRWLIHGRKKDTTRHSAYQR